MTQVTYTNVNDLLLNRDRNIQNHPFIKSRHSTTKVNLAGSRCWNQLNQPRTSSQAHRLTSSLRITSRSTSSLILLVRFANVGPDSEIITVAVIRGVDRGVLSHITSDVIELALFDVEIGCALEERHIG